MNFPRFKSGRIDYGCVGALVCAIVICCVFGYFLIAAAKRTSSHPYLEFRDVATYNATVVMEPKYPSKDARFGTARVQFEAPGTTLDKTHRYVTIERKENLKVGDEVIVEVFENSYEVGFHGTAIAYRKE